MGLIIIIALYYFFLRHYDLGYPAELANKEFADVIENY